MNKVHGVIASVIMCGLASGCTNGSSTALSIARLQSPEVSEKPFKVSAKLGVGPETRIDLTRNDDSTCCSLLSRPNTLSADDIKLQPEIDEGNTFVPHGSLSLSVASNWEVSYIGNSDHRVMVKYQFAGNNREQAKKGNLSQAVTFSLGRTSDDFYSEGQLDSNFELNHLVATSASQETDIADFAWVIGYRLADKHLVYGGPFYTYAKLSGRQNFSLAKGSIETGEPTFTDVDLDLDSEGSVAGINFAYEYNMSENFFTTLELSWAQVKWEQDKKQ